MVIQEECAGCGRAIERGQSAIEVSRDTYYCIAPELADSCALFVVVGQPIQMGVGPARQQPAKLGRPVTRV